MYLQKTESTYGRVVPKPEAEGGGVKEEAIDETPVPIQDQIENLRTKINLKGILKQIYPTIKTPHHVMSGENY